MPEIKEYLEKRTWVKNLPFSKQPKVDFIKPKQVTSIVDETGKLVGSQDITPMALANLAIDLAGEEGIVDGVLDRIVEGLRK